MSSEEPIKSIVIRAERILPQDLSRMNEWVDLALPGVPVARSHTPGSPKISIECPVSQQSLLLGTPIPSTVCNSFYTATRSGGKSKSETLQYLNQVTKLVSLKTSPSSTQTTLLRQYLFHKLTKIFAKSGKFPLKELKNINIPSEQGGDTSAAAINDVFLPNGDSSINM